MDSAFKQYHFTAVTWSHSKNEFFCVKIPELLTSAATSFVLAPYDTVYTNSYVEDAETLVKCELTIDNSEAVQQCLAIKPVVILCVPNFKHPRTIAKQPARQPGRNTAWARERSCYLSRGHRMMFVFVTFDISFHWSRLLFYGLT